VAYALAVRFAHRHVDAIGKMAQVLTQCHHAQTFALSTAVQQGMELGAQPPAHRGRDTDQFVRELVERMAQTEAEACSWKQGPHTVDGTVKAIGEGAFHLVRWLILKGSALKRATGRGERRRALGRAVTQVPDHPTTDDGGQINPVREATAVFLIGQDIRWQWQATLD
jgi:hypothetical protein